MERKFSFSLDEFYHIYNRGVDKRLIFIEPADYDRFVKLLYLCNGTKSVVMKSVQGLSLLDLYKIDVGDRLVNIGAYCLMPNHFHLLLREICPGGISAFVMKICTAYSMYFNKKYERAGSLFQGPFGARHLDDDVYLKYVYAYIHLNPLKILDKDWVNKMSASRQDYRDFLDKYRYSSYLDYVDKSIRPEYSILNKKAFPEYFSEKEADFSDFINDWLEYKELVD